MQMTSTAQLSSHSTERWSGWKHNGGPYFQNKGNTEHDVGDANRVYTAVLNTEFICRALIKKRLQKWIYTNIVPLKTVPTTVTGKEKLHNDNQIL